MMDATIIPAYPIVDYAWAVLKSNMSDTWTESKYGGLIPVVPLNEEPEINGYSGPHIVYGYAEDTTGYLHERSRGSVTFAVYDDVFRRLSKTMTVLIRAFERHDDTATDINNFTTKYLEDKGSPYLGIRFGTVDVAFAEGGTPEDSEGGRQSAIINIRYECYIDYDINTQV